MRLFSVSIIREKIAADRLKLEVDLFCWNHKFDEKSKFLDARSMIKFTLK